MEEDIKEVLGAFWTIITPILMIISILLSFITPAPNPPRTTNAIYHVDKALRHPTVKSIQLAGNVLNNSQLGTSTEQGTEGALHVPKTAPVQRIEIASLTTTEAVPEVHKDLSRPASGITPNQVEMNDTPYHARSGHTPFWAP